MPLLMRWPAVIQAGTRINQMVQNIDYAPTFLDIAGVVVPEEVQGRSLLPLLQGQSPPAWRQEILLPLLHGYSIQTCRGSKVCEQIGTR